MDAQISLLRRQLRYPLNKLAEMDKVLANMEETMPKGPGRWSKRTREFVEITLQLCKNECVDVTGHLNELCNAIDEVIKK